jgi:hypothetical protein
VNTHRFRINTLALAARLPTMHMFREGVEVGGLMSYGANFPDAGRATADDAHVSGRGRSGRSDVLWSKLPGRMIVPLFDATNPYAAIHQLLEADIVCVRDFTRPDAMSNEQLGQLAMIAHHCYRSHHLVLNCIHHLESRRAIASGSVHIYARTLHSSAQQSL